MTFDITVQTRDLVKVLNLASSIVEKRHAIPILGNVKLEVDGENLYVTATDADIEITQNIGVTVRKQGAVTVSAQILSEIVRKIPDTEVSLQFIDKGAQLHISSTCCDFKLPTLLASDFPIMEDIVSSKLITIAASALALLLEHTKFAMSTEETRYNLNGIYLHADSSDPSVLHAAATDCHRLSVTSTKVSGNISPLGVILPSKAVQEILKILKDPQICDRDIELRVGYNRLQLNCHNIIFKSKIIDGSFPEYKAFIPETNEYKLVVQSKTLAEIIDRVSIITVEKFRAVKIICDSTQIEVHASGAIGVAQETLSNHMYSTLAYSGPQITIGFNPKYILDALNAVSDSAVTIELQNASSPVVIRPEKYPDTQFIVMPINV